jgi:hypothetical protein
LEIAMTMPLRAALYLRVSTGRQADNDLSIPDQRRQAKAYCASRGWEIVADYVEPGLSATDDRRPEFQRMIDAATTKPPAFDVILVHSFSRFFRDQFQLEFYVRRLAKAGVPKGSFSRQPAMRLIWCRLPYFHCQAEGFELRYDQRRRGLGASSTIRDAPVGRLSTDQFSSSLTVSGSRCGHRCHSSGSAVEATSCVGRRTRGPFR